MEYKLIETVKIQDNTMTTVHAGGKNIMLAQVDGQFSPPTIPARTNYVRWDPKVSWTVRRVICGCHGSEFDLKSGKVMTLPATVDLATYPVAVKDGYVWVTIA